MKDWIKSLLSGLLAAIIALVGAYLLYHRPQINLLEQQIILLEQQIDVLEQQLQDANFWENYRMIEADIAKKCEYSPDDPIFEDVEDLCKKARDAREEGDYDKARSEMEKAREQLQMLPGPPVTWDVPPPGQSW